MKDRSHHPIHLKKRRPIQLVILCGSCLHALHVILTTFKVGVEIVEWRSTWGGEVGRWTTSGAYEPRQLKCNVEGSSRSTIQGAERKFQTKCWQHMERQGTSGFLRASSHLTGRIERPNPKFLSRGETKVH